jgi:hypothetical protein
MELRIAFGGAQPILGQQIWIVEVDRRINHSARRIHVDHFEVLADRPGLEPTRHRVAIPRHSDRDLLDRRGLQAKRKAGVERIDPKPPERWNVEH